MGGEGCQEHIRNCYPAFTKDKTNPFERTQAHSIQTPVHSSSLSDTFRFLSM